jgi:hypothetical protein
MTRETHTLQLIGSTNCHLPSPAAFLSGARLEWAVYFSPVLSVILTLPYRERKMILAFRDQPSVATVVMSFAVFTPI